MCTENLLGFFVVRRDAWLSSAPGAVFVTLHVVCTVLCNEYRTLRLLGVVGFNVFFLSDFDVENVLGQW